MDTSVMTIVETSRLANEGDLYLDTVHNVFKIGLTHGKLAQIGDDQSFDSIRVKNDSLFLKTEIKPFDYKYDLYIFDLNKKFQRTLKRVTNTPDINEDKPFEKSRFNYVYISDEGGAINRHVAVFDSTISAVDTVISYRYFSKSSTLTNYNRSILDFDYSPVSKKIGLLPKVTELATGVEYNAQYFGKKDEFHLMIGKDYKGGYGWIFPLQNNRAIVGFGTFDSSMVKGLKDNLNAILELPNIKKLVSLDNDIVEGGSIPITPVIDKFVQNNLVCVGDSVSQVNPIVGEGYKFIFESAIMASKAINEALKNDDLEKLSNYEQDWRERFLSNYNRSKTAQKRIFSLSKKDYLTDFGMVLLKLRANAKNVQTLSGEY